jgi:hypothetical protein
VLQQQFGFDDIGIGAKAVFILAINRDIEIEGRNFAKRKDRFRCQRIGPALAARSAPSFKQKGRRKTV